ncbi:MAG: hypothetical protein WCJ30_27985 [Deltaproteobacteria bacterium]
MALCGALACVACDGPLPRIRSVSATRVVEHRVLSLVLSTEGCAPGFDIDHASQTAMGASMRLGPGGISFPATRNGSDSFTVALGDGIPPGAYPMDLVLDDGRHAPYDGDFTVAPLDPVITAISTTRSTIGFGETRLPVSVTVDNPSACAVDGLRIVPSFRQGGVLLSFPATGPLAHVDPHATTTLDFTADVSSDAMSGTILVNAVGVEGTHGGRPGCSGPAVAVSHARDAAWVLVPAVHQSITVTDVRASTHVLPRSDTVTLTVTARNDAAVTLTPERLDVGSVPAGIVAAPPSGALSGAFPAGSTQSFTVIATASAAEPMNGYVVSVVLTARDADGALYASPGGGPSVSINVH